MNVNFKVIFMKKQLLFCSLALASSLTAFADQGDKVTELSQLSNNKCYLSSTYKCNFLGADNKQ